MNLSIPLDKWRHLAAGSIVAIFALVAWVALAPYLHLPNRGAMLAMVIATTVAGAVKEVSDWLDNRVAPGSHEVSLLDAFTTFVPGVILGAVAGIFLR